jgi:hypothetical protein
MSSKPLIIALAIVGVLVGTVPSSVAVRAQDAREAEILGFHQLCDRGDRKACVKFGMMLGEMRERHADWRRTHPQFWRWER